GGGALPARAGHLRAGAGPRPPQARRLPAELRPPPAGVNPMPGLATPRPARRPELLIRPLGDDGGYVVKDPCSGVFFQLGEAEHFLLTRLDGELTAQAVRAAYAERFGEALAEDELDRFVELARSQGLLQMQRDTSRAAAG